MRDARDLRGRLDNLRAEQHQAAEVSAGAERSAHLAAIALASALPLPAGRADLPEVLQEYLAGLLEDSRLKDYLARWVDRYGSSGAVAAPVTDLVVPDPGQLEDAAASALEVRLRASPPADPKTLADRLASIRRGDPAVAAVDLANQARFLDEGTGPCTGCVESEQTRQRGVSPEERPPVPKKP